ncbi:unnamed protein product [Onchocerca ochengi]|uniref:Membrane-associated protein n=1 Tax=Onchocerca ochengi TaxID=42157 RepID=A0A182EWB2_ONCOC|nr:unnamed protein product [Onchocerca ochengi]
MRRTTVACVVLLSCSALAIILLLPVVINATVVRVDVHTGSLVIANQNETFHPGLSTISSSSTSSSTSSSSSSLSTSSTSTVSLSTPNTNKMCI